MKKQKIRGVVLLMLLIFWILSTLSGLFLYFAPKGQKAGQVMILEFQKREWIQIHSVTSVFAVITTVIHIFLEWPVFIALLRQLFRKED